MYHLLLSTVTAPWNSEIEDEGWKERQKTYNHKSAKKKQTDFALVLTTVCLCLCLAVSASVPFVQRPTQRCANDRSAVHCYNWVSKGKHIYVAGRLNQATNFGTSSMIINVMKIPSEKEITALLTVNRASEWVRECPSVRKRVCSSHFCWCCCTCCRPLCPIWCLFLFIWKSFSRPLHPRECDSMWWSKSGSSLSYLCLSLSR